MKEDGGESGRFRNTAALYCLAVSASLALLCFVLLGSAKASTDAKEVSAPTWSSQGFSDSHLPEGTGPNPTHTSIVPGRYIVVLEDSVARPAKVADAQVEQRGGELGFVYRSALTGYSVEGLSRSDVQSLRAEPTVKYVVPDRKVRVASQTTPTGLSRIFATENKSLDIDGADDIRINADVAVIDTGIDHMHPDLNVVFRTNCVPLNESEAPKCVDGSGTDVYGHGTHVAGIVGALDNGFGAVGVAPGARVWSVKVLGDQGVGYESWIVAGINWVTAHASEIEVANMSLAGSGRSLAEEEAIKTSINEGVVYAVAAGNSSQNTASMYPGNVPDVITVSALTDTDGKPGGSGGGCSGRDDTLAEFSNWGSGVDIAAPGGCIFSTLPMNGSHYGAEYGSLSGTSMATPYVAGAAAYLASKSNPNSRQDVEGIRQSLLSEANLAWEDTSEDTVPEPLLYLGEEPSSEPEAATGGHTSVSGDRATLYGATNPRGQAAEYQFEYGTTTGYGQKAPVSMRKFPPGTKHTQVQDVIRGLKPEQTYHYRLVMKTAAGTVHGQDQVLTPSLWKMQTPTSEPSAAQIEYQSDVSCSEATACMAVGYYYDGENRVGSYELSNGQWSFRPMPTPSGIDGFPEMDSVSCVSANTCTAVGKVQINGSLVVPLVERWNGSTWSMQSITPPAGPAPPLLSYARLTSVSCPTSSECIAVGYYKASNGKWVNYSARWSGGVWSNLSTPNLAIQNRSELTDVSCSSTSFCVAVGASDAGSVIMAWQGSAWSLQTPARNAGLLFGVSCVSMQFCEAVGPYPYAEKWNGTSWALQQYSRPNTDYAYLNDISCTSATFCRAVGEGHSGARNAPYIAVWDGTSWQVQSMPRKAEELHRLWGISCTRPLSGCTAVGGTAVGQYDALIETLADAQTLAASDVTGSRATMNGSVISGGIAASYRFEYGPTASYGASVPVPNVSAGSGGAPQLVSRELMELPAETTFHYRLVASNEHGTVIGSDRTFRTRTATPQLKAKFGSLGNGDGKFNEPKGIAVDKEGNVYVADSGNNRIEKFNPKGEFISKFGSSGSGNGQLSQPQDIAIAADGSLWVTDAGNDRVQRFDQTGKYLGQFGSSGTGAGQFIYPKGIAIATDGTIWVSDFLYESVEQFTPSGQVIRVVGAVGYQGNGQTSFSHPNGIAAGLDGTVWVADMGNDQVQHLSASGQYLGSVGVAGEAEGELEEPAAIDVKSSGDLLIADRMRGRVQQLTADGDYVMGFGQGGVTSDQEGLAASSDGVVYVSQSNDDQIERWEPSSPQIVNQGTESLASEKATLQATINPRGAAASYRFEYGPTASYGNRTPAVDKEIGAGNEGVHVAEPISGLSPKATYHMRVVVSGGGMTIYGEDRTFTTREGPPKNITLPTVSPAIPNVGVQEIGTNGTWTSEDPISYAYQWRRCNAAGGACKDIAGATATTYTPTEADIGKTLVIKVMASDISGTTFASSNPSYVVKATPQLSEYALPAGSDPAGIVLGSDGNVWVTEEQAGKVAKLSPGGAVLAEYSLPAGSFPSAVVVGPDKNLWVTEYGPGKIAKITTSGTVTEFSLSNGAKPIAITVGPDGNLWFANSGFYPGTGISKIGKITTSGAITEYALPNGSYPAAITAGPDGNLWFTYRGTSKIGRITTSGTITEYALPQGSNPEGMTWGPDDKLWFVNAGTSKIGRITTSGTITEFPAPEGGYLNAITAGPGQNLWYTNYETSRIGSIDTAGNVLGEFALPKGSGPWRIVKGSGEHLWFTNSSTSKVGRILDPNLGFRGEAAPTAITGQRALSSEALSARINLLGSMQLLCSEHSLSGEMSATSEEGVTVTPSFGGCAFNGASTTVEMRGCAFVLHASGLLDVAGAKCAAEPMRFAGGECTVTIGPQSGLPQVTYGNYRLSTGMRQLSVAFDVSSLQYTAVGAGCKKAGTFSSGGINALLESGGATDPSKVAQGIWVVENGAIRVEKAPATITAKQQLTNKNLQLRASLAGGQMLCAEGGISGEMGALEVQTLTVKPSFSNCSYAGQTATVEARGCSFVLHPSGTLDLAGSGCAAEPMRISIPNPACTVTVGPQSNLSQVTYGNYRFFTGVWQFQVGFDLAGISHSATGAGCISQGAFANGTFNALLESVAGVNSSQQPAGVWVDF